MNKIGILYGYWSTEWEVDYIPYIHKVKELGFDVLEINSLYLAKMKEDKIKRFRDIAKAENIDILAVLGVPAAYDIGSPDAAIRKAGIDYQSRIIKACSLAEIPCISGILYSSWPARLEDIGIPKAEARKNSIKTMKEIIKYAEDYNVDINLEVVNRFENYMLNTCQEAMEYIDEVDSKRLFVHLDSFHMNIEEDSFSKAIHLAGDKLGHFHIGENNRKPPGCGFLPWQEIFTALKDIHYKKAIVMEPFVQMGGTVGRNIGVYRDIMPGVDLDKEAKKSLAFVREFL